MKTAFTPHKGQEAHMQQGSVILTSRKFGPDVWQFRWSEKGPERSPDLPQASDRNGSAISRCPSSSRSDNGSRGPYQCTPAGVRSLSSKSASILNTENCDPAIPSGASPRSKLIGAIFASGLSRAGVSLPGRNQGCGRRSMVATPPHGSILTCEDSKHLVHPV